MCVYTKQKEVVPLDTCSFTVYGTVMRQFQQFKAICLGEYQHIQRLNSKSYSFMILCVILDAALTFRKVSSSQLASSKATRTGLSQCTGCQ